MAEPLDSCIGWWKFNDNLLAEIGQNGSWTGTPTYDPIKFSNGIDIDAGNPSARYVVIPEDGTLNPNDVAFEMYLKPNWAVTNGGSGLAQQIYFGWRNNGNNFITMDTLSGSTRFLIRVNGSFTVYTITTGFTWLADTVNYLLIAFVRTGIDGGATKVQIWLNDNLVFSSTTAPANQALRGNQLYYGTMNTTVIGKGFNGGIDNPKIYQNVTGAKLTLIRGNRQNEGFPVSGRPFLNKFNRAAGVAA